MCSSDLLFDCLSKCGMYPGEKRATAIAYETIQLPDLSLPVLKPMSEVAGKLATQIGAYFLQKDKEGKGKGILLGGVPGVKRGQVTIIGGGIAGMNAAKIAIGMGAEVTLVDRDVKRLEYLDDIFGTQIKTLMSNISNIEESVRESDLVIGAVLVTGANHQIRFSNRFFDIRNIRH